MRHIHTLLAPCILLAISACSEAGDPVSLPVARQANVVFVNAMQGAGRLALNANGTVTTTAQAFGTATSCASVDPGITSLTIGNTSGTTISAPVTSSSVNLSGGNNVAVIAAGTTTNPQVLVVPTVALTPLAVGIANVSVVNATPVANVNVFFAAPNTTPTTPIASSLGSFSAGTFRAVPIGNSSMSVRTGTSTSPVTSSAVNLSSGESTTVLLIPNANGTGFQTLTVAGGC